MKYKLSTDHGIEPMIGNPDGPMGKIYENIIHFSENDYPVLLTGETGVGKNLAARIIHEYGKRRNGPFESVIISALPENLVESELFGHVEGAFTGANRNRKGKIELADKGTLYLDEIGDINPDIQVKLLGVLENKYIEMIGSDRKNNIDVRFIASTNADINRMLKEGTFRKDLFYRIGTLRIDIPPLRERPEDIRLIACYLNSTENGNLDPLYQCTIDEDAFKVLEKHDWPGNVRELDNLLKRASIEAAVKNQNRISRKIVESHLESSENMEVGGKTIYQMMSDPEVPLKRVMDKFKKRVVEKRLEQNDGNRTETAKQLGVQRTYMSRLISSLGIKNGSKYSRDFFADEDVTLDADPIHEGPQEPHASGNEGPDERDYPGNGNPGHFKGIDIRKLDYLPLSAFSELLEIDRATLESRIYQEMLLDEKPSFVSTSMLLKEIFANPPKRRRRGGRIKPDVIESFKEKTNMEDSDIEDWLGAEIYKPESK